MSTRQLARDVLLFYTRGDSKTCQKDLFACFRSHICDCYSILSSMMACLPKQQRQILNSTLEDREDLTKSSTDVPEVS